MRVAWRVRLALTVVAVAFATALYIHQRETASATFHTRGPLGTIGHLLVAGNQHPSWENSAAAAIAITGIALAVGIVAFGRPLSKRSPDLLRHPSHQRRGTIR